MQRDKVLDKMRILTALLCAASTRAHFGSPRTYSINPNPHLLISDDRHQHLPNGIPYPRATEPFQSPHGMIYHDVHQHPYYGFHHHPNIVHPYQYVPPYVYPDVVPSEPHIPGVLESPHIPDGHSVPPYFENFKAAQKFAAVLNEDTHIDGPTTMLDLKRHYNALLAVLLALAEGPQHIHVCIFDTYYEDRYLAAVEEHYTNGLLNPNLVSHKVEYYSNFFQRKINVIKSVIETVCDPNRIIESCDKEVDRIFYAINAQPYHEATILQAIADLSVTYDKISDQLKKASEQYLEFPYLLKNKEVLKELVGKMHLVLELTSESTQSCKDNPSGWGQSIPDVELVL